MNQKLLAAIVLPAALCVVALSLTACGSRDIGILVPNRQVIDFGEVYVGRTAGPESVDWTNQGKGNAETVGFAVLQKPEFALVAPKTFTAATVAPGQKTGPLSLSFTPPDAIAYTGAAAVVAVDGAQASAADVKGVGVWSKHVAPPNAAGIGELIAKDGDYKTGEPLDFETVEVNTTKDMTFDLVSISAKPLVLVGKLLANNQNFTIKVPATGTVTLAAASITSPSKVTVTISFTPPVVDKYQDVVQFSDAGGAYLFGVVVKGKGKAKPGD